MKAMILAAGKGSRLKPLTDTTPKALVEVGGKPMLARLINVLKRQGFNDIVINVSHLGDQIIEYLKFRDFGVKIRISDERGQLMDTGGGILKAAPLFFEEDQSPVLIHNVDILSNADLNKLMKESEDQSVLLVSQRESTRKLIFNKDMHLKGWQDIANSRKRPENLTINEDDGEFSFSGIYTLTSESIKEMNRIFGPSVFPIMDYFLNPSRKEDVKGLLETNLKLIDIGKPATLLQAEEFLTTL